MSYPIVTEEFYTLEHLHQGKSISRIGEGEFKIIMGRNNISQIHDHKLQEEMRDILWNGAPNLLVGLPNIIDGIKSPEFWNKHKTQKYTKYINPKMTYYSAFITRADVAPKIATKEYWERVKDLWRGKNVVLVRGERANSLTAAKMPDAAHIDEIIAPYRDAYAVIDNLEKTVLEYTESKPDSKIVLCLGATATVLAARLCKRGLHAMDLGYSGMFMKGFI